ncbi:oligosaccharide flippase family protein [Dysgonomonas reticulitermitis]
MLHKIKNSSIARRLIKGVFWSFVGTASAKFIILIAGIIVARILGKEEYGELGIIRSTINTFVIFASMGLGLTATKYISQYRESDPDKAGSIYILSNAFALVLGFFMLIIVVILAPYIANNLLNAPNLITEIRYGGLLLLFSSINGAQAGTLAGFENFKSIAINTLIAGIFEGTLLCVGAYYEGVRGAIFGSGISFGILYLLNFISIRKNLKQFNISYSLSRLTNSDFSVLWKFSVPAALSSILVVPVFWYIRTLLVKTSGFHISADFDVADQWRGIILFIPAALSRIVLPMLSNLDGGRAYDKYVKILKANLIINFLIALFLAIIISFFAKYILSTYGEQYTNTIPLILLAASTIFTTLTTVVGQAIASKAKMWIGLSFNLIWALSVIILTYVFLSKGWGASGLALAILISYSFFVVLQIFYLRKLLKYK